MASVDQLNFEVIISDKEFDDRIRKDIETAKKFNLQVSTYLDIKRKYEGLTAAQARAAKTSAQVANSEALNAQKITTEQQRTLKATTQAALAQLRLNRAREQGAGGLTNMNSLLQSANSQLSLQNRLISNATTLFTSYVSVFAVERFISSLARVRGEFELQQVSLRAIMQDVDAADKTFSQLKGLAVESPFQFKELARYAKQLSAYNIANEDLYDSLKRIADLSAGVGVSMDRLILAYGQVRSAEFLRGQEIRQFSEAGINLVGELADRFSKLEGRVVSAGEVFDRVSKRMVSFEMVKEVIDDLTNEGGRFFDQQRVQAQTLAGQLSNLRDAYEIMLNDLGKANDGLLKGGVSAVRSLFENWEKVATVLKTVVVTYAAYKGVFGAGWIAKHIGDITKLGRAFQGVVVSAKTGEIAIQSFNKVFVFSPWGLAAAAIAGVVGALTLFNKKAKSTAEVIDDLNEAVAKVEGPVKEINTLIERYETLSSTTNRTAKENNELDRVIKRLSTTVEGSTTAFDEQGRAMDVNIAKAKEWRDELIEANKVLVGKEIREAKKRLEEVGKELEKQEKKLAEGGTYIYDRSDSFGGYNAGRVIPYTQSEIDKFEERIARLRLEQDKLTTSIANSEAALSDLNRRAAGERGLDEWQKKFNDFLRGLNLSESVMRQFEITDYTTLKDDILKKVTEAVEAAQKELDQTTINFSSVLTGAAGEEAKAKTKAALEEYKKVFEALGLSTTSKKTNAKNPRLEAIEKELSLLTEARKAYEDLRKTYGSITAGKKVESIFGLKVDDQSFNTARANIIGRLEGLGKDGQEALRKVQLQVEKEASDIVASAYQTLQSELAKYKDQFNFYEELLGLGADKDTAINIAFGTSGSFDPDIINKFTEELQRAISERTGEPIAISADLLGIMSIKEQLGSMYDSLSEHEKKLVEDIEKMAAARTRNMILQAQKYLQEQKTVAEKIKDIEKNTAREIEDIRNSTGFDMLPKEEQEKMISAIQENGKRAVAALESDSYRMSGFYQKILKDLSDYSYKSLEEIIAYGDKIQAQLETPENQAQLKEKGYVDIDIDGEKIRMTEKDIISFTKSMSELNKETRARNPFKALSDAITENNPQEKVVALSDIFEGIGQSAGELSNLFSALGVDADSLFSKLLDGFANMANSAASFASAFASGNMFGMVTGGISMGVSLITTLVSVFDTQTKRMEKIQNKAENIRANLQWELDNKSAANLRGMTDSIWEMSQAATVAADKIGRMLPPSFVNWAYVAKNNTAAASELKKAIADIDYSMDKDLGADKYQGISSDLNNLAEQYHQLGVAMEAEEGKRSKDRDDQAIEEYRQQMAETAAQMREIIDSAVEDIMGGSAADLAAKLGDALVNAFRNGEDAAEAWGNTVDDIITDIVKKLLVSKLIEGPIAQLFDHYTKEWFKYDDGTGNLDIASINEMLRSTGELKAQLDKLGPQVTEAFEKVLESLDLAKDVNEEAEGTLSKSIKGITEDTADKLAGYLNAMRQALTLQGQSVQNIEAYTLEGNRMRNMHAVYLQQIAANTYNNALRAGQILVLLESVVAPNRGGAGQAINVNA